MNDTDYSFLTSMTLTDRFKLVDTLLTQRQLFIRLTKQPLDLHYWRFKNGLCRLMETQRHLRPADTDILSFLVCKASIFFSFYDIESKCSHWIVYYDPLCKIKLNWQCDLGLFFLQQWTKPDNRMTRRPIKSLFQCSVENWQFLHQKDFMRFYWKIALTAAAVCSVPSAIPFLQIG